MTRPERTARMMGALQGAMGLNDEQMAARVSVSRSSWSLYKRGRASTMRLETWWRLCDLCRKYGIHVDKEDELNV